VQVYGAQLSQELPGGLHRPMRVHEGLFDLLESSLHLIVENVPPGVERHSTVQYMQKLFQVRAQPSDTNTHTPPFTSWSKCGTGLGSLPLPVSESLNRA
jgi:hypothetical protein